MVPSCGCGEQGKSVFVQIQELPFSAALLHFEVAFTLVVLLLFLYFLLFFDDKIDPGHPVVNQLTGGERGRYQQRQSEA